MEREQLVFKRELWSPLSIKLEEKEKLFTSGPEKSFYVHQSLSDTYEVPGILPRAPRD